MAQNNKGNIIESPQTLTGSWVDMGSANECLNYSFFSPYIDLTINDSKNVRVRFRGLFELDGDDYIIPCKIVKQGKVVVDDFYYELDSDIDQKIILQTETDQNIYAIKVQVMAGTVGDTAGVINSAMYIQGYRQ
jgi:hypothetical protein